jgi:hypothetical protein
MNRFERRFPDNGASQKRIGTVYRNKTNSLKRMLSASKSRERRASPTARKAQLRYCVLRARGPAKWIETRFFGHSASDLRALALWSVAGQAE